MDERTVAADGAPDASPRPPNRGAAWTIEEEQRLYDGFASVADIADLARRHGRDPGGIQSRLRRLGLIDPDGHAITPKPPFTPSQISLRRAARSHLTERATAAVPAGTGDADAEALALLAHLGPARRAIAIEVLRGLAAREAAGRRVAGPDAAPPADNARPAPEKRATGAEGDEP